MTLHRPGMGVSGDCFAKAFARYRVIFVWIGNDSFSIATSRSVFLGSSIIDVSPAATTRLCRSVRIVGVIWREPGTVTPADHPWATRFWAAAKIRYTVA